MFNAEVELEYDKRKKSLNVFYKMYLWLQRNYVQDILFRISEAHLIDMISQFKKGRTSIKTPLEIGLMDEIKLKWLEDKNEELT